MKAKRKVWNIVYASILLFSLGFIWDGTAVHALSTGQAQGYLPWLAIINESSPDILFLGGNVPEFHLSAYADNSISDPVQAESTGIDLITASTIGAIAGSEGFFPEFGLDSPTSAAAAMVDPPADIIAVAEGISFASQSGIDVTGKGNVSLIFPYFAEMQLATEAPAAEWASAWLRYEVGYEYYDVSRDEYLSGSNYQEHRIDTEIGNPVVEFLHNDMASGIALNFLIPEEWSGSGELTFWTKTIAHTEAYSAAVPEPATMLMLGLALAGFAVVGRKKLIQ